MVKPRIVAIDDESEFIDMLLNYFEPRGYDINVSIRGVGGIEIIKAKKPDVVLCDLKMPGIDGDEVLKLVKTMQPEPKLIFVTAYDDGGKTKARLLKMGAYAYFDKPIASLKALEDKINMAVNG
ncbi:MAG: response regulator [Candidatus Omnitrophica bacterium]|nr:response regulator [Candidatus Omnitrophota bacterium]